MDLLQRLAEENEEALAQVQKMSIRFFSEEETMAVIIEHIMKNSSIRTLCERSLLVGKDRVFPLDDMVREELDRIGLFSVARSTYTAYLALLLEY